MADSHGHEPHAAPAAAHHHPEPAEDTLRTPAWLTALGIGLVMAGALGFYVWMAPAAGAQAGTDADGGAQPDPTAQAAPANAH